MNGGAGGPRSLALPFGLFLVAIGLAHREAFFSWEGLVLLLVGGVLLASSVFRDLEPPPAAYPLLFFVFCLVAALAPYDPSGSNLVEMVLTAGAGVAFYVLGAFGGLRRFRLPAVAGLLVLAHVHYLLRFPHPLHQDVWTFLNLGSDLLAQGHNPYAGVRFVEDSIGKSVPYTYPPGALLVLTPFRILLGDVRWATVAAEVITTGLLALWLRRSGRLTRPREALVLLPLALPRTSQAFYIFSNHEWVLLALAAAGVALLLSGRDVAAGLVLGVGVASKQYFVVFPLLFLMPVLTRRAVVVAVATAGFICLPFLLWSPGAFVKDIFGNLTAAPDAARLTVWAAFANGGVVLPRLVLAGLSIAALLVAALAAWVTRGSLRGSLLACGLALWLFALCSSFAAYNYYAYALVFITWGLLCPRGGIQRPSLPSRD